MHKLVLSAAVASLMLIPAAMAQPHRPDHRPPPRHHGPVHVVPAHPGHRHYVPGRRYRTAPHGWHRYRHRPRDWRTRGCILVGPVWFCP